MLHVYMLDCAARLVTAQDVATSAFALRIKRGFCCRLLPLILLPLGSYQPFNLRIGSGAFGLMASGDASSSAAPGERGAASPTVATEAAPQTVRPPRAEEVPVPETPQGTTRHAGKRTIGDVGKDERRKEQRGMRSPLQLPRHQLRSGSLGLCQSREMQLRPKECKEKEKDL